MINPLLTDHAVLVASARHYRLTNSTAGRYGQGFVNGYVARCLREAARLRLEMMQARKFKVWVIA
jgi:hypothetical protein